MEHTAPGEVQRKGPWMAEEIQWFRWVLRTHPGVKEWGLLSMNTPGRNGRQCREMAKTIKVT